MRRLFTSLAVSACLFLAVVPAARAAGPATMSYQGVLTDGLGNLVADGAYSLTFRIYSTSVGGVALWSEVHPAVQVTKGGFSVILGSTTPINLPFSSPYYLGVQVGAGPELAPRISLAASPYAMSLWMLGDAGLRAGDMSVNPTLGDGGGFVHLYNSSSGATQLTLEPDANGDALFGLLNGAGSSYLLWNGNAGTEGSLVVNGSNSSSFNPAVAGNGSVNLPNNAIASSEMLDEPGIAQGHENGSTTIPTGGTMSDVVIVDITTPAAGYIVVEADAQHGLGGNGTQANYTNYQIDETAGGTTDSDHYFASGYSPSLDVFSWNPISIRRVYQKAAGTYRFRLEASATNPGSLSNYFWNPTITATFYPTSYGPVVTAPNEAELAQFSDVKRTTSGPNGPGGLSGTGALVDLRELELRVRREEARLAEARRQLETAQLEMQLEASKRTRAELGREPAGSSTQEAR